MRTFLFSLCAIMIGVSGYAQAQPDSVVTSTSFKTEDGLITMTQRTDRVSQRAYKDDLSVLSPEELTRLFAGKAVVNNEKFRIPILASTGWYFTTQQVSVQRIFGPRNVLELLIPAETILAEEANSGWAWFFSFFGLYLPIILIAIYLFANKLGFKDTLSFLALNGFIIAIVTVLGGWLGMVAGTIAVILLGFSAFIFSLLLPKIEDKREKINYPLFGPFGACLIICITGLNAGYIRDFGFTMSSPEFSVMWGYLLIFAGYCSLIIKIKLLVLFYQKRRSGKGVSANKVAVSH